MERQSADLERNPRDDRAHAHSRRPRRREERSSDRGGSTSSATLLKDDGTSIHDSSSLKSSGVEKLLSACDSIVRTCLSYRTLTPVVVDPPRRRPARLDNKTSDSPTTTQIESMLQLERDVERWLDDKIFDAERNLRILERRVERADSVPSAPNGGTSGDRDENAESVPPPSRSPALTEQELRHELRRRTSQLQLEHRFLKRVLVSKWVQQQSKCVDADDVKPHAQASADAADDDVRQLQRRATRARDRQVLEALQLKAELADIREQQREAIDECSRLQQENRELWDAVQVAECDVQRQRQDASTRAVADTLEVENRVLQQLLRDLVLGSSLDWFGDERLQAIVAGTNRP